MTASDSFSDERPRIAIGIDTDWATDVHYSSIEGILTYGREVGWNCRLIPSLETSRDIEVLGRVDGIVARVTDALAAYCTERKIPTVNIWLNSPVLAFPRVIPDIAASTQLSAEHLIGRGFKDIAFLGLKNEAGSQHSIAGIEQVQNAPVKHFLTKSDTVYECSEWIHMILDVQEWIQTLPQPIGIIVMSDFLGRILIDACHELGLTIPEDVAIVSQASPMLHWAKIDPTLTSLDSNYHQVGYQAASTLDKLLHNEQVPSVTHIRPKGVVARQSSDTIATEDRVVARALRYIWDNAHTAPSVSDVAASVGISRRSLERRFRQAMNHAIHEEIINTRLRLAARMLIESDEAVKGVAVTVGFKSSDHFSRSFKKQYGMPPLEYRKRNR